MLIAVIADPHLHDTSFDPRGDGSGAFRSLDDTVASTRVFNESVPAFRAALDDVVRRGIRHVLILGDLTDDGQEYAVSCARKLLSEYQDRYGMRFFACVGNHDLFAMNGCHRTKVYVGGDGDHDTVTSDPSLSHDMPEAIVAPPMYCKGYPSYLEMFGDLGYRRSEADFHWESPFGHSDTAESRTTRIAGINGAAAMDVTDASYLVEPVEGLWLLSLDPNVYRHSTASRSGAIDAAEAGWNAALQFKPYLLPWIADVVRRARSLGKQLLAFSHYPVLNPLPSAEEDELALLGQSDFIRRMPRVETRKAIAETRLGVHFSGHWHVDGIATSDDVINVAVPSLVGFPAAYKVVEVSPGTIDVETVPLGLVPDFDMAFESYGREVQTKSTVNGALTSTQSYGAFLSEHIGRLAVERYLEGEWPTDLACQVRSLTLMDVASAVGVELNSVPNVPFQDVLADWYRLRRGGALALEYVEPRRLSLYRSLVRLYATHSFPMRSTGSALQAFMVMLGSYIGPKTGKFSISLVARSIHSTG
ncbi:metallophosphoesterase family protein [Devosia naphthalenivorans]|uniref:metallophosphoesterase family protein n=1 Tax=Devosia naphthalenivorans TaxID=2082392 RepID=UPI0013B063CF|nr:metallophosphoesterase [Devosia naphthalenivorans]